MNKNKRYLKRTRQLSTNGGVTILQSLRINGKPVAHKKRIVAFRSEGWATSPRELAYYLFRNQRLFSNWHHRRWDIYHSLATSIFPKEKEAIESAWQEFFTDDKAFIEKLFEERNKRTNEYTKANDYLKMEVESIVKHFHMSPLPIKYSFLYWMVKIYFEFKYDDIKTDAEVNCPQEAKEWIDQNWWRNETEKGHEDTAE